jgi:hypothetical protein
MPRLPKRPTAPRPRGVSGAVAATLRRRRDARAPRVIVRDRTGQPQVLDTAEDPLAMALLEAADELISAAQSGLKA